MIVGRNLYPVQVAHRFEVRRAGQSMSIMKSVSRSTEQILESASTTFDEFCLLNFARVAMRLSISISIAMYECGRVSLDSSNRFAIILRICDVGVSCTLHQSRQNVEASFLHAWVRAQTNSSILTVCVRCVLCTRFLRPAGASEAGPEACDASGAGVVAAAVAAAAVASAGAGTVPPVPGGANGVDARRKSSADAWIFPSATRTSPCKKHARFNTDEKSR